MKTEILHTHTPELFQKAVWHAAELLRAGEVVALPTETVYGLAANALDEKAVARIYEIKGRPSHNPIIVHVAGIEMAKGCAKNFPAIAENLSKAFWPGPLTLILFRRMGVALVVESKKAAPQGENLSEGDRRNACPATESRSKFHIPNRVTAGGETVGIRWPSHPFIQAVIRECDFPLAAPSANLSNQVSPTNAEHVRKQLEGKIPLIVDGGQSQVGIESTVLDLTVSPPRILRPGMIHRESLVATGLPIADCRLPIEGNSLKSPGLLKKHYAPKAKLFILNWRDEEELDFKIKNSKLKIQNCHIVAHTKIPAGENFAGVSVIPHDAEAFARAIYAELHRCDEAGAEVIIVEAPPELPEWSGIADRLRRAAA